MSVTGSTLPLRDMMRDAGRFLVGIELVTSRGTMEEEGARRTRQFAGELVDFPQLDWVSITDNAGGNPQLGPLALGKPILYAGREVIIHLSCKDYNRNGLEQEAWLLASEGFHNLLALSGDYPIKGHAGNAKPVFDIDSVALLTMLTRMNNGLTEPGPVGKVGRQLAPTCFFKGAVTTNFKLHENEVMPQYFKLEKKIECGAEFIINQIGYDSRKAHELLIYLRNRGLGRVPLIGNVYLLNPRVAEIFHQRRIPGVVVSDELWRRCAAAGSQADKGRSFFLELAARQMAIHRGLGYRGVYFGGVHRLRDFEEILRIEAGFAPDDWRTFAREIQYGRPGEFYLYAQDPETGLADGQRLNPEYEASLETRAAGANVNWTYRISKAMHDLAFTKGRGLYPAIRKIYERTADNPQGPAALRMLEHAGKSALFNCRDCGDCSLPDIAFLCPESQCAKNQRNGPCGGTRDGRCEVEEFECIWARAYDRRKHEGDEGRLLEHAPVIQDQGLRGTSSWANMMLDRDHHASAQPKSHETGGTSDSKSKAPRMAVESANKD